uniref:Lipocalin n=1 Tax=Rhipicephalus appendiculatus TaxID=34631 RepID=A0A131YMG9_RHIAP
MHVRVSLAILILFCTHYTSPMQCFPKRRPIIYSIIQFVSTRQRVWTYKISQGGRLRCQYNTMRAITPQQMVYNRTYLYAGHRRSISLLGLFDAQHRNRMYVRTDDLRRTLLGMETLLYEATNTSCGVVKTESIGSAFFVLSFSSSRKF